jgi:hypothetical protein
MRFSLAKSFTLRVFFVTEQEEKFGGRWDDAVIHAH